jgi:hypothetical protein
LRLPPGSFRLVSVGNAFPRLDRDAVATRLVRHLPDGGCVALFWGGTPWRGTRAWQRVLSATLERWKDAVGARDRVPEGWEQVMHRDPHERVLRRAGLSYEGQFESLAPQRAWRRLAMEDKDGRYDREIELGDLPAGLPPGQLITPHQVHQWTAGPVYWVSQQPLADAPQQWARLQALQDRTGLRPLLLGGPDDSLSPCDRSEIDGLDAEPILMREWNHFVELRRQAARHTTWRDEIPASVWIPEDPGPPFAAWPGLARPGSHGRDPDAVAREVVARRLLPRMPYFDRVHVGLVPATRSADIPALMGTEVATNHLRVAELSAVLRSWEDRFGARVVAVTDGLYLSVAAPPLEWEHAEHLALEHLLICPDNLTDQPV